MLRIFCEKGVSLATCDAWRSCALVPTYRLFEEERERCSHASRLAPTTRFPPARRAGRARRGERALAHSSIRQTSGREGGDRQERSSTSLAAPRARPTFASRTHSRQSSHTSNPQCLARCTNEWFRALDEMVCPVKGVSRGNSPVTSEKGDRWARGCSSTKGCRWEARLPFPEEMRSISSGLPVSPSHCENPVSLNLPVVPLMTRLR